MSVTSDQVRAARALLRLDQAELARRAEVSPVTIRRLESSEGMSQVSATTMDNIQTALEKAGVEFIQGGVRWRPFERLDRAERLRILEEISLQSAALLRGYPQMTEDDLYDENGLPA